MLSIDIQRRVIISTCLLILVLAIGFGLLKYSFLGLEHFPIAAFVLTPVLIGNIIYIKLGGNIKSSQLFVMFMLLAGFTGSAVYSGGYSSGIILVAPVLPMVAILWFDRAAGMVMAGLVVALLSGIYVAELKGLVPPNPQTGIGLLTSHFFGSTVVTVSCAWLLWALAEDKEHYIDIEKTDANTDHLTRLANRRALDEALSREVGRAKRDNAWISFALIDVDFFKRYNDTRGHQAGDECLIKISNLIASRLNRPGDFAGRFGGEEFALLLPDTDPEGAYHIAENLRKSMASLNLTYTEEGSDLVTVTIGVISMAGSRISSIEYLVKEADAALYRGKSNGRNQVVIKAIDTPLVAVAARN